MTNPLLSLVASIARLLPMSLKQALYRFKPLAGLIRHGLNQVAPQGLVQVDVAAGKLEGMHLCLDLQLEKDYWLGTYEPQLLETISDLARSGMIAYDLGANVGYVTLMLAQTVGDDGHVYAFEAHPDNVERLRTNIFLNNLNGRVTVQLAAVAGHGGQATFLIGPSTATGKVIGSGGREIGVCANSISVPAVTLDDFVYQDGNEPPDIIKMDIEGGEVLAIPGMKRLLAKTRPLVLMELHGFEAAQIAWKWFIEVKYGIYKMKPGYPPINSLNELDWKTYLVAKPL